MFILILLSILLGITIGIITGIIPGLHPNTVFVMIISLLPLINLPIQCMLVFVVSLAITNTFTDFLPSIIFGAPEPSTSLSVLPGHRMLLSGRGYEALFLTVVGGLSASIVITLVLPLITYLVPLLYNNIHNYIHIILAIIVLWMVLIEKGADKIYAFFIFVFSGVVGIITLGVSDSVLFPSLSGLFGLSTIIIGLMGRTVIPPQEITDNVVCDYKKGTIASILSGMLVGILPGIGSTQAGIITSQLFKGKIKEFLMALGGINTANIIYTIIVFYSLGKIRSGSAWALSQISTKISFNDMILVILTIIVASCLSSILTLSIGKRIIGKVDKFPYKLISVLIVACILLFTITLSGVFGIVVLFTCTFLGIFTILLGINRTHLMGFLILPTILYFSGVMFIW